MNIEDLNRIKSISSTLNAMSPEMPERERNVVNGISKSLPNIIAMIKKSNEYNYPSRPNPPLANKRNILKGNNRNIRKKNSRKLKS